jgi:hypothetical protein
VLDTHTHARTHTHTHTHTRVLFCSFFPPCTLGRSAWEIIIYIGNYYLHFCSFSPPCFSPCFSGNWHKQTLGRSAWEIIIYVGRYYLQGTGTKQTLGRSFAAWEIFIYREIIIYRELAQADTGAVLRCLAALDRVV